LREAEAPLLILSGIGILIAFVKAQHRFAMFAGLWAFGLFAAYSIIPYKTPWIAISFILPMCIAGGYAINEMLTAKNPSLKITGGLLAAIATAVLAYQTYDLNFVRYDDEDQPYIYAHTHREFLDLMNDIERYAGKSVRGKDAKIEVVSVDYWPMVWYLRDYTQANFHGFMISTTDGEMIVAKKRDQDDEVIRKFSSDYRFTGRTYHLRSGVDLVLLVRKDLADPDAQELYRIRDAKDWDARKPTP
jgi:predicted membrane-bound mannosyltransferase